jgi:hypothetical protein
MCEQCTTEVGKTRFPKVAFAASSWRLNRRDGEVAANTVCVNNDAMFGFKHAGIVSE